jgi:hypothetical protein
VAIVAKMIGGPASFQIADEGFWQNKRPGVVSESPTVARVESLAFTWGQKQGEEPENTVRLLSWLYEFRNFAAITSFLRQSPHLVPLLLETYGQICLRFGSESRIALELFTDPEADSDRGLVAIIRARLTPEQAQRAMDDFDMEWWLDALPRAKHKLTIVFEYI